ncbi:MAG: transposase [Methanobrevibacter sp.]|jgi:transposase|nr:transposase [Candidatus Methanoflexus mossambicus]
MSTCVKSEGIQSTFIWNVPGKNLDPNHIVFTVKKLVNEFYSEIVIEEVQSVGRPLMYSNEELLGLIVYGQMMNKTSVRELEQCIKNRDESFLYITNNKKPSKSTIARFYAENSHLIDDLFYYIVKTGEKLDLIGYKHVAIDGTILKAFASRFKLITIEEILYLEKLIGNFYKNIYGENIWFKIQKYFFGDIYNKSNKYIIDEIKNNLKSEGLKFLKEAIFNTQHKEKVLDVLAYLKENYDGTHTISVTDPESRWMKNKQENIELSYNYQVAVDDKHDFIVAQRLVQDPTDHYQLIPMIEETLTNLKQKVEYFTADTGYLTDEALYYLYYNDINAIIPDKNDSSKLKNKKEVSEFKKTNFQYNPINDTFTCPQKETLEFQSTRRSKNKIYNVYSTKKCKKCKVLKNCTKQPKREILEAANPLKRKMKENYNSDFGKQLYQKRFHTGETYFGHRKITFKNPQLKIKTLKKAEKELTIQSIAHNIKIIHKHQPK